MKILGRITTAMWMFFLFLCSLLAVFIPPLYRILNESCLETVQKLYKKYRLGEKNGIR